ncbi:MAG: 2Fe-2S iron-sulfur cluster-binding protein [Planctomycetota bacterium]|nr:2Fe-2S iron-sulfur cluster-binding protein [Planctomycetota bacterium]MDA1213206.1 2Fe-2S iron-sulfur cluster-binding protein [Planctomycetota bacterium]
MTDHGSTEGHSAGNGVQFTFDGQIVRARPGQTFAGALHDAGIHTLSRSFKYHRPRGLFCVTGRCPNCMCSVNGEPNVRVCTRKPAAGDVVKPQNAWPSVRFDIMSIFDKMHRLLPVGFYYKTMHKPRFMWPIFESVIRRIAGLGEVDLSNGGSEQYDKLNLFTDVVVVGGGLAGLNAAYAAAEAGADVILIDDQPTLGGHVQHDPGSIDVHELAVRYQIMAHPRIQTFVSSTAFGLYEENYVAVQQGNRMIRIRAQQTVVASGGWERPYVFENNDLPGVLLASGAQRLLQQQGCKFDGPIVIVTDQPIGYRLADQLKQKGMHVAALVDLHDQPQGAIEGLRVLAGHTIQAASGKSHVTGAAIVPTRGGTMQTIPCQWIIQAVGFTPATSLLYQSGCKLKYNADLDQHQVTEWAQGVHSAGAVNGYHEPLVCVKDGTRAGLAAANALGLLTTDLTKRLTQLESEISQSTRDCKPTASYISNSKDKKKFVCICEDVTEKDLCDAIDEGYANIETLKRYSTISMGPCQGKMCQSASIAICARHKGIDIEAVGTTTSRPPEQPVPLGVLAGQAPHFSLIRRTAMHHWHEEAGARFLDAGTWKRPERYTDPHDEYQAVRKGVGLIDVSTLGKIELRGPDVVKFLEFIYPNRFANLAIGKVRYGAICDEAGILLDDGMICRLDEERFYLSTSTGNADAIDSWFRWWLTAKPQWDISMTNMSTALSGMNLAGPHSRDVLRRVSTGDVSNEALPYPSVKLLDVAGVPAIVLRIGFVGELGFEIHVPSQYGLHVWNTLMEAGKDFDIKPFGVEAQRRLRLDKKHLLPGVDTDALSNMYDADLPWIVKLDKEDFIGRWSLNRIKERGPKQKLIGFKLEGTTVPDEASLIVKQGSLVGRVTSVRYSPAAGSIVGLAWVPIESSKNGDIIDIRHAGQSLKAVVQDDPFYDVAGERLNS